MANPAQLAVAAAAAGATARVWDSKRGITIRKIPLSQISELAAGADLAIDEIRPFKAALRLARRPGSSIPLPGGPAAYFAIKVPLAALGLAVAAGCWLGGLFLLIFPAWRALGVPGPSQAASLLLILAGAALLLAAPWLTRGTTEADRWLDPHPTRPQLPRRADPRPRGEPGARRGRLRGQAARHRAGPARRRAGPAGGAGHEAGPGQGEARHGTAPSTWPDHAARRRRPPPGQRGDRRAARPWPGASTRRCWTMASATR